MMTKIESQVIDQISNLIVKGLEVHQLRNALMSLKMGASEPGGEDKDELIEDVRSDLDVAREDMFDILQDITDLMEDENEQELQDPESDSC